MNTRADLREDPVFIGRDEELFEIVRILRLGLHTLLVGPRGIGKNRLIREAVKILTGEERPISHAPAVTAREQRPLMPRKNFPADRIIQVSHVSPLGDCLKELAEKLHIRGMLLLPESERILEWPLLRRKLTGLGTPAFIQLLTESLAASRFLVILETLDRISASHQPLLKRLFEVAIVCGSVTQTREATQFRTLWPLFHRIDLGPLSDRHARQLVQHFLANYSIHAPDREIFIRRILKASGGSPFHIRNLLWQSARGRSHGKLPDAGRREQGDYFNMGPVYIFAASLFTLSKIFSIGMDNREFYIYFSALGFLVYLTFRVFRTFFLFRPQKYDR